MVSKWSDDLFPMASIVECLPCIGMRTERKWMKLIGATFVFIFFCKSGNRYKIFEKNRKTDTARNRYGPKTAQTRAKRRCSSKPRNLLNHAKKLKQLK
jgi:hypothetical protein